MVPIYGPRYSSTSPPLHSRKHFFKKWQISSGGASLFRLRNALWTSCVRRAHCQNFPSHFKTSPLLSTLAGLTTLSSIHFLRSCGRAIKFELTARGSLPTTFSTYLAAAISVEQNQVAAALSRSQPPPPPSPRLPFVPRPIPPPTSAPPPRPPPPSSLPTPMDLDGSRGFRGSLTLEERRRWSDAGLCAYCAQHGHLSGCG